MSGQDQNLETKGEALAISTSTLRATTSGADWIASAPAAVQSEFLDSLSGPEIQALPYMFEFWAHPHQLPPEGTWRSWVVLGGRGAGKTRAGAEWVRSVVEGATPLQPGLCSRLALVAETMDQARDVMIFGESGIMACTPADRRPAWVASRKMLVWPNGATAKVFSAHSPETLRGPQFDAVWADEIAKWSKAEKAWTNVQLSLRLGDNPRVCATTTPQNVPILSELFAQPTTVVTHAPTEANRAYLGNGFLDEVHRLYAGTRTGKQELDGILLAEIDGALWTADMIDRSHIEILPEMDRVVVAIDPPAGSKASSDDCGIIVVGVVMDGPQQDWRAYVLEDATMSAVSPIKWAQAAIDAMERHGADRLIAEVNQGGDMVESLVRQVAPMVSYTAVHASKAKTTRAEPVAALYERGRVKHVRGLRELEDQMAQMSFRGFVGRGSPDRVDALVWAVNEAMQLQNQKPARPRLRAL